MSFEVVRAVSSDHPSLRGHFPGAPIVPAVVILDEVANALGEWRSGCQLAGIKIAKFLAPLKPAQSFTISLSAPERDDEGFDFSCRVENRVIVQGRLLVRPATT